ncbi:MAG: TonB-dependent receptor, partial [Gammaproteobacteria bacterium]
YASAPAPIAEGIGAQQDLRGRTLPFAPPVSATLTPTLEIPFAWLTLVASIDIQFQDRHYSDTDLDPSTRIPATTTYAAQLAVRSPDGHWSVTLGGTNLTDERVLNQVIDSALFPGTYIPTQQPGRSVFGMVSLRW